MPPIPADTRSKEDIGYVCRANDIPIDFPRRTYASAAADTVTRGLAESLIFLRPPPPHVNVTQRVQRRNYSATRDAVASDTRGCHEMIVLIRISAKRLLSIRRKMIFAYARELKNCQRDMADQSNAVSLERNGPV